MFRTDGHNNPTAFTTDVAKEAGLVLGLDYTKGDSFSVQVSTFAAITLFTARLIGDPIALTIRVIDAVGFYTRIGSQRWGYIGMPADVWSFYLSPEAKAAVIGGMYEREGGTAMLPLFSTRFLF